MQKLKAKELIIQRKLLTWYKKNKRKLPWRKLYKNRLPNPYFVLISEYMLQQTTVGTVKKKFEEFILKWPTISCLANISESKILSFWSGLGYYARARNLLKTAKIINKDFKGKIPNTYNDLIKLPGIGDYTAKAILGIAYNKPVMPIDANIERIISRVYGFRSPLNKIKYEVIEKSKNFISYNDSNNLIQSFMDYGSLICTPRNPNCKNCFIKLDCIAFTNNLHNIIPVKLKIKSLKRKKYSRAYIFCNEKNEILVRKRSSKGMLASMLEVPNDNWVIDKKKLVHDNIVHKVRRNIKFKGLIEYSFSHFNLETQVFYAHVKKNNFQNHKWIKKNNFKKSGLPTVMKKIIEIGI